MDPLYCDGTQTPAESSQVGRAEKTGRPRTEKFGVLVVDDEHLVRIMVKLGLEHDGFDVWLAANSRTAIDLYQTHRERIGAVLLDAHLPGQDGAVTLDALRRLNPEVLVCLMSSDAVDEELEESLLHGAAHLIAKPFHLDQLTRVLRLLLQGVPGDASLPTEAADGEL
jgi:two-component system response regulator (stage 0 sporulation protein F)